MTLYRGFYWIVYEVGGVLKDAWEISIDYNTSSMCDQLLGAYVDSLELQGLIIECLNIEFLDRIVIIPDLQ